MDSSSSRTTRLSSAWIPARARWSEGFIVERRTPRPGQGRAGGRKRRSEYWGTGWRAYPAAAAGLRRGPGARAVVAAPDRGGRMHVSSLPVSTERLLLRLFTPRDVDDMYSYQGLPSVARYLYRPPRTREACAKVIAEIATATRWTEDGDQLTLAVCRREGPEVIGEIILRLASA